MAKTIIENKFGRNADASAGDACDAQFDLNLHTHIG